MNIELPKNDNNDNRCTASSHSTDLLLNSNSTEAFSEKPVDDSNMLNNVADNGVTDKQKEDSREKIDFKVICNKNKIDVTFPLDGTIAELKDHLQSIVSIPTSMQKILIKGIAKDNQTLRSIGVSKGAKVMVVGSKIDDVLAVSVPTKSDATFDDVGATATSKEPLSQQKLHRKILDKGIPDDVMPGILDSQEPLPDFPLSGMLNKSGGKVRLTFKLEQDQLWIGTKERTDKIPMTSIKDVQSEPIHDHPEYHIMAIQLGTTDASKYWIYWVPSQYVAAIKEAVLA
ncbi:ubiquitin domain-containing protein UBFD1 isoform X3 [Phymastichus coffea]|uniref:ubiquitin domain-containing protein UBFD1 isoform X3 n=1 Tax=Phymastichus coffea TaxID=108790 RepID=UPI00273C4DD0|nr:ubiquitin domain-containing protein UBFD1 isoform X3 [Phymastichus coffea]